MTKGHMCEFYQCEHHQLINYHQNLALYTYLQDFDRKLHAECNELRVEVEKADGFGFGLQYLEFHICM